MAVFITLLVVITKTYFDVKRWGKVRHGLGLFLAALVIIPLSVLIKNPYPIFLYGMLFNPAINIAKRLSPFYIGNTAVTDKILKQIFGNLAGEAFFLLNLILLIYFIL